MIPKRPGQKLVMLDGRVYKVSKVLHSWEPAGLWRVNYYNEEQRLSSCLAWYRNGWWKEYQKPKRINHLTER